MRHSPDTNEADERGLTAAWFAAVSRREVADALGSLFERITQAIDDSQPACVASGRCCHFKQYGHRLFVTGLEAAWCVAQAPRRVTGEEISAALAAGTCPYLVEERCSVHLIKPMSCRVFFCDPDAREWQQALYESSHREIVEMHTRFAIPYRYAEWGSLLNMIGSAARPDHVGVTIEPPADVIGSCAPGRFVPLGIERQR